MILSSFPDDNSPVTPFEYYYQKCQAGIIVEDPQQLPALKILQSTYENLLVEWKARHHFFSTFRKPKLVKGVYLWGGVGIGKTFLLDCFFNSLPFQEKMRMHFYQFMQKTHNALTELQGKKDPLQIIAKQWATDAMVLCFDEFFVSDITDAMLLGRLLRLLFIEGVTLVATSNTPPEKLYQNGLQREQFIPAIRAIQHDTQIVHIPTEIDYRLRHLKEAGVFYTPLGEQASRDMEKSFSILAQGQLIEYTPIQVFDRVIPVCKRTKQIIWFDFQDICHVPRSQKDYLVIAQKFHTVFISDIPVIAASDRDTICLFIGLIDVLYDARVKLVISAAEPVEQIYNRCYMIAEFTRTHSRLLEMQSRDYFGD